VKAADVMVTTIISVRPDTPVHEAARILLASRISAVLVLGEGDKVVGILSEGDLLRRVEVGSERRTLWRSAELTATARQMLAESYVKSRSRKVADVMTRGVITADRDTPLFELAGLMEKNHIKRVPIVDGDKVLGIVTRADILKGLVLQSENLSIEAPPDDDAVRSRIIAELNAQPWSRTENITITVRDGVVDLHGLVDSPAERSAVRVAAETAPGVRQVNDHLNVYSVP
jgi:CBS domain-containing protein